jgi:hypothetical protein
MTRLLTKQIFGDLCAGDHKTPQIIRAVPQYVAALTHFAASYEAPMNRGGPLAELRHQDATAVDGPRASAHSDDIAAGEPGLRV